MSANTVIGDFSFGSDAAKCPLYGYSAKTSRPVRDIPEPVDPVEIVIAFSDPTVDSRVLDAIRKARQYGSYAPISFCGYHSGQFYHARAVIRHFEDPGQHGQAGYGLVARLCMTADWLHWGGPLTTCLPPISLQAMEPPKPVEASPVQGRLLTDIAPGAAVGLSSFKVTCDEETGTVTVEAQVARSRTAYAAIYGFSRAWPDKVWPTVEGDWKSSRFDMKNVRCIEATEDGRLVLTVAAENFKGLLA